MTKEEIQKLFGEYLQQYDEKKSDAVWAKQSARFRKFWETRILGKNKESLSDSEIDEIVLILDKNGKGSTRETQAVAKMMIPQGQWYKMFRQLQTDKRLGAAVNNLFIANTDPDRIKAINDIYALNAGSKNHMTGKSGNGINGLLAAYNPTDTCFIVSLPSRLNICKLFDFKLPEDFDNLSQGDKMVLTNNVLLQGLKGLGFSYSSRVLSEFCYYEPVKELISAMEPEFEDLEEPASKKENTEAEFKAAIASYDQSEVENYFEILDQILGELSVTQPDKRITFSCKQKRLSLIIGQRYCYSLYREAGEIIWGCISSKKINSDSTKWDGPHKAYYNFLNSAEELSENLETIIEGSSNELDRTTHSGFRGSNNPYFEKAAFDKSYRINIITGIGSSDSPVTRKPDDTMAALNQIFFGPPGTGKTYHTINEAVRIIDPEFYSTHIKDRDELRRRFKELLINDWDSTNGQIAFCTFHQSFSYEDFVEGIKPVKPKEGDDYLKYMIEDGVFKRMCRLSDDNRKSQKLKTERLFSWNENEFKKAAFYKISLGDSNNPEDQSIYDYCIKNNCIAIGYGDMNDFSGLDENQITSKSKELQQDSFAAQALNYFIHYLKNGNYVLVSNGNRYVRAIGKVTGEYRYDPSGAVRYNHFRSVEWLVVNQSIPVTDLYDRNLSQMTIYKLDESGIKKDFFVSGSQTVKSEESVKEKNYVLIIDEINRGNVSSIFGELITLIERDKRAGSGEELEVILPYSKETFKVPNNVYIVGTMNTADRSIEALDTALRRRFSFREMPADPNLIMTEGKLKPTGKIGDLNIVMMLGKINERIGKLIDKDHKIGHSYFMDIRTMDDLKRTFKDKVIPLLEEYFFGDFGKIGLVLGDSFVEKDKEADFKFAKFGGYEDGGIVEDLGNRPIFRITKDSQWDFAAIYA